MTWAHAAESVECQLVAIVTWCSVASAESSMIDISLKCAVWGQDDCQRTCRDYVTIGWLNCCTADMKSRSGQFFYVALCTITCTRSLSIFSLVYLTSSMHRAHQYMHQQHWSVQRVFLAYNRSTIAYHYHPHSRGWLVHVVWWCLWRTSCRAKQQGSKYKPFRYSTVQLNFRWLSHRNIN